MRTTQSQQREEAIRTARVLHGASASKLASSMGLPHLPHWRGGRSEEMLFKILERKHCNAAELPSADKEEEHGKMDYAAMAREWNYLLVRALVKKQIHIKTGRGNHEPICVASLRLKDAASLRAHEKKAIAWRDALKTIAEYDENPDDFFQSLRSLKERFDSSGASGTTKRFRPRAASQGPQGDDDEDEDDGSRDARERQAPVITPHLKSKACRGIKGALSSDPTVENFACPECGSLCRHAKWCAFRYVYYPKEQDPNAKGRNGGAGSLNFDMIRLKHAYSALSASALTAIRAEAEQVTGKKRPIKHGAHLVGQTKKRRSKVSLSATAPVRPAPCAGTHLSHKPTSVARCSDYEPF